MLEKHSDSGEFDEGRSGSCNEEGDDSDDDATSANGSRSSLGDEVTHSVPGVGISPENFDPTVIQTFFISQRSFQCRLTKKDIAKPS